MPSSPKHRRRKKKGNGSSGSRTPKGSPKQNRRKHKRTNPDGSPRKRGGKKGVGVKASRSVPVQSSTLTRASFSSATPRLPMPGKSHSAPSSPRVSRRGANAAPSPSQLADAIATKRTRQGQFMLNRAWGCTDPFPVTGDRNTSAVPSRGRALLYGMYADVRDSDDSFR